MTGFLHGEYIRSLHPVHRDIGQGRERGPGKARIVHWRGILARAHSYGRAGCYGLRKGGRFAKKINTVAKKTCEYFELLYAECFGEFDAKAKSSAPRKQGKLIIDAFVLGAAADVTPYLHTTFCAIPEQVKLGFDVLNSQWSGSRKLEQMEEEAW